MSFWEFWAGNISPWSFILGWAFHRLHKPLFSWFARVKVQAWAVAHASCQGLLLAICEKLQEPSFQEPNLPFSISKFGSFKNPFAMITSLSKIHFKYKIFILFSQAQRKEMLSMSYGSSTNSWKSWGWTRLDLIFIMRNIYIYPILELSTKFNTSIKFSTSSSSTKFKNILQWNISQLIIRPFQSVQKES